VLRALDSLNPRYKNVILLKYMEGLSYDEIGEILGVSIATIRSRLYRAKSKLQSILRARVPHLEKHWCEQHLALTPEMADADTDYLDGAGGLLSAL
jgi:transposase